MELETCIGTGPRGNLIDKKVTFQYVPLLETLKALLSHDEVIDEVCTVSRRPILLHALLFKM